MCFFIHITYLQYDNIEPIYIELIVSLILLNYIPLGLNLLHP